LSGETHDGFDFPSNRGVTLLLGAVLMCLVMDCRIKSSSIVAVASATIGLQVEVPVVVEKVRPAISELELTKEAVNWLRRWTVYRVVKFTMFCLK
jgi:hypothetical protein